MRYLVFDTQFAAQGAVDQIDVKGRAVYASAGYTIDTEGNVVGQCDGVDNPEGVTTTWDIPRQRQDGKWLVTHPENFAMADYEVSPGVAVKDYVMAGIIATIEDEE